MKIRKRRDNDMCIRCGCEDEHLTHILTCRSKDTNVLRRALLSELSIWIRSVRTYPLIILFFKIGLKKWFRTTTYKWEQDSNIFTDNGNYYSAFGSQLHIGWFNLLCSFLREDFITLQQNHYVVLELKKQVHDGQYLWKNCGILPNNYGYTATMYCIIQKLLICCKD